MKRHSRSERKSSRSAAGFSLLEVLVGLIIFVAGILGLIGLQATSIRLAGDAKYRSDAAYLAEQVIGRIWTDRINIAAYAHMPTGTACTPTGTASTSGEITAWLADVSSELPSSSGSVIVDTATSTVTVRLCWNVPDSGQHQLVTIAQIS